MLDPALAAPFPVAALPVLRNVQLRKNVAHAIDVIQAKRARLVEEKTDWQELRAAAAAIKDETLEHLGAYLEQFEERCTAAGGHVHWARGCGRGAEDYSRNSARGKGGRGHQDQDDDFGGDPAESVSGGRGCARLRDGSGGDHSAAGEWRAIAYCGSGAARESRAGAGDFCADDGDCKILSDDPKALTAAARTYLRQKFLSVPTAISGANFLIAETGGVAIVESEGNGRMCLTLPRTLITLAGIEKVVPRFQDLEVMLQLLARSATGERMSPYTSLWTGVTPGDGPQNFHVVLLDNERSSILGRKTERQTLRCIRCAACMNTCPVYRQTGGHAYGSVYPGPIGAILTPQLEQMKHAQSLPFASSLCGACYEVCPVKINIPEILIDLRARVTDQERQHGAQVFRSHVSGNARGEFDFCAGVAVSFCAMGGADWREVVYAQRWMDSFAAERGREVDADAGFARAAEADVS